MFCRNERAQETPDSEVFINFPSLISARLAIFQECKCIKMFNQGCWTVIPRAPGGGRGRRVWGAQTLCGGVSAKAVGKRHVKGSHNITSHFSLYHASLPYSYKIKEVFSVISPGS